MRRHAKASSVGSNLGIGSSRRPFGGAAAIRGASGGGGSGAPSARGIRIAAFSLLAASAFVMLSLAPPAFGVERAFEQVTPVEKYGDPDVPEISASLAAADGNRIAFSSFIPLPVANFGSAFANHHAPYVSYRTADRWITASGGPRMSIGGAAVSHLFASAGPGLVRSLVGTTSGWHDEPGSEAGVYMRDYLTGTNTLLWPVPSTGGLWTDERAPRIVSSDLSHALFISGEVLTSDPGVPASEDVKKLYEWVDGQIRLVSFDTSNVPFGESAWPGSQVVSGGIIEAQISVHNALSDDARHIFFSTPASGDAGKIYRRSDGTSTMLVSPSKSTVADPLGEKAKTYKAASVDGDVVFFTSSEQLTDDANTGPARAGTDLYRYEISTDTLVDLSAEANDVDGAQVRGVVGTSDDGRWVYYVASGQVVSGKGTAGQPNLYLWHDDGSPSGETRFIATLVDNLCGDVLDRDGCSYSGQIRNRTSRVSNDGETAIFTSAAPLTGYPNNGHAQIYIYKAAAQGGAGQLSCVSCNPGGGPAQADAITPASANSGEESGAQFGEETQSRALSADGSRVYFNSSEALRPEDTNGAVDVYEWEDGALNLISSGQSPQGSYFAGASASGDDVFFFTRDQLVAQDTDTYFDLYDARVGGGLASQFPPPPGLPCVGEACKPAAVPTPQAQAPGSAGFTGPGNRDSKPGGKCSAASKHARKLSHDARRLRRQAKHTGNADKAERMRQESSRLARQAGKHRKRAKRCLRKQKRAQSSHLRRANHNRGTSR